MYYLLICVIIKYQHKPMREKKMITITNLTLNKIAMTLIAFDVVMTLNAVTKLASAIA